MEKSKKLSRKFENSITGKRSKAKGSIQKNVVESKRVSSAKTPSANLDVVGEIRDMNILAKEFESKKHLLNETRLKGDLEVLVGQINAERTALINKYEHEIRILRENTEKNGHVLTEFKLRLDHNGPYVRDMEKNINKLEAEKRNMDDDLQRISKAEISIKTQADGLKESNKKNKTIFFFFFF